MNNQNFSNSEYPQKSYSEISSPEKLRGVVQLLEESWSVYILKIKTLSAIIGLPVGFSLLFWFLMYFLAGTSVKYSIWFSVIGTISYLGSLFLWLWAIPSLLYNFKEDTGVRESYKKGFKILSSYIWVYFLLTIIIAGGFLLFIIPGILFSIWFSLAIFVLVFEEKKGLNTLFRSKHLVTGKFWGVLWRFLVLGLTIGIGLFLVFALIIFGIENKQIEHQISEVIRYFVQLFVLPFFLIYGFLIYNNLKEIQSGIVYEEPTRNRKIKYAIPGILGILIVGLLASISFFNIFWGRDEVPVDDRDLWLSKIEIPKEENAFYYLAPYLDQYSKEIILEYWPEGKEKLKESKEIYWPREKADLLDDIIKDKEWDEEFVGELLKDNEQALNDFEKVVNSPYFQDPITQDPKTVWIGTPILSLGEVRNVAELNLIKAIYLFKQAKEKEAFTQTIKVIKMGQLLEDSPRPTLISYLVGMLIKEMGLQRLRIMLTETNLTPEVLKSYINRLEKFKLNEKGLINILKMGYIDLMNTKHRTIDAIMAGETSAISALEVSYREETPFIEKAMLKSHFYYKPNKTRRIFAEYYRVVINNVNKNYSEKEYLEIEPLTPLSKIKMIFTENLMGKMFHDAVGMVSFSGIFSRKCQEDFSVIGTQLLMAIKAYQIETGKTPLSLDELVPKYISEIPEDPFDGKPIRYSPEKKNIYSVGKDLKDSGGSEGEDWRIMEDPTFKFDF